MDSQYACSVIPLLGRSSKVAVVTPSRETFTEGVKDHNSSTVLPPDEVPAGATYRSSHVNTEEFADPSAQQPLIMLNRAVLQRPAALSPSAADLGTPTRPSRQPHTLGRLLGREGTLTRVTGAWQSGALCSFSLLPAIPAALSPG